MSRSPTSPRPPLSATVLWITCGLTVLLAALGLAAALAPSLFGRTARAEWLQAAAVFGAMTVGVLGVAGAMVWLAVRTMTEPEPDSWRCASCQYDLRGTAAGRCPECGREVAARRGAEGAAANVGTEDRF
ncbi:MAG: hypothetical protein ACKVZJ_11200 [Phycisphaerales bacterium]